MPRIISAEDGRCGGGGPGCGCGSRSLMCVGTFSFLRCRFVSAEVRLHVLPENVEVLPHEVRLLVALGCQVVHLRIEVLPGLLEGRTNVEGRDRTFDQDVRKGVRRGRRCRNSRERGAATLGRRNWHGRTESHERCEGVRCRSAARGAALRVEYCLLSQDGDMSVIKFCNGMRTEACVLRLH